jgi:hypothetical protein
VPQRLARLGLDAPARTWLWLALCLLIAALAVTGMRGALNKGQVTRSPSSWRHRDRPPGDHNRLVCAQNPPADAKEHEQIFVPFAHALACRSRYVMIAGRGYRARS